MIRLNEVKKSMKAQKNYSIWIILGIIILFAGGLRFVNLDWDEGTHVHPDERFLSMLTNDIKWPGNITEYFNTAQSSLNPANAGKTFFVYGTFPVFLTKFVADVTGHGHYGGYPLTGRALAGIFDLMTIIVLFLIALQLFDKRVALLSAFLLAGTVLHIQHSHFFVVDLFATFFIVLSFYLLLLLIELPSIRYVVLLGACWGLALASKISSSLFSVILVIGFVMLFGRLLRSNPLRKKKPLKAILRCSFKTIGYGLLCVFIAFTIFRIAQPYAFEGPHLWNIKLAQTFVHSFEELKIQSSPAAAEGFVPGFQWIDRPPYFQIKNLTLWGLGVPLSILCWLGLLLGIYHLIFRKDLRFLLLCAWPIFIFGYYMFQFGKVLRYTLPAVPFLVLLGAFFIGETYSFLRKNNSFFASKKAKRNFAIAIVAILVSSCLFWTFAFVNIYFHKLPLVQASAWIYENVPENSTATIEPWDNGVPFHLRSMPPPPWLNITVVELFGADSEEKMKTLSQQLSNADYIFITSGRNYLVLPRLKKHPMIKRYYELLFNESLGFTLAGKFTNYPTFLGIEIKDDNSEESFIVYDHPTVFIFKNEKRLKSEEIANLIKGVE